MSVRPATAADTPPLVELGRLLHSTSSYASRSFDAQKVGQMLDALRQGAGVVYCAEHDDEIVGGVAGGVAEHWFGHDLFGYDFSVFVHPEHRHGVTAFRLLLALESWCKLKGATEMRLGITTGMASFDGTARLYEFSGYTRNGALFVKDFDHGNR